MPRAALRSRVVGAVVLAGAHLALAALGPGAGVFAKYPNLAARLAQHDLTPAQVGDASPAYLLLNVAVAPSTLRWTQWLLAGLSVALLFVVLHRLAGALAAWLGAGLLAASAPWLVYGAVLEPDLVIGVCLLVSAAALSADAARRWPLFVAAGAIGVAISLRPTALVFAALAGAWALRGRPRWPVLAAAGVGVVAAVLPSTLLHLRTGHDLRGTMSAGQVFHQSHRPESVGFGAVFPSLLKLVEIQGADGPHTPDQAHELYREMARADDTRLDDVQTEGYWLGRTLAFFREAPGLALRQELSKALFFLAPPSGEYDIPAVAPLLDASPGVPLRWLTLLAAGALLSLRRARLAALAPWALQWLAALAVALLFYFHGRYAVGLVPALAALGGVGLADLLAAPRTPRRVALLVAPCALLALPSVRWTDGMVARFGQLERLTLLRAPTSGDPWLFARENYAQQQAAMPDVFWPTAPRGAGLLADDAETFEHAAQLAASRYGTSGPVEATLLAGLQAAAGRCADALATVAPFVDSGFVWSNGDVSIDPRIIQADCLLAAGHRDEAVRALEATNQASPARLEVLARLVAAGDTGAATELPRWEHQLFAVHDGPSTHFALARARRRWGDPDGALEDADWVAARWPRAAPFAQLERALALEALGRHREALEAWTRAAVLKAPVHGEATLDRLVDAASADLPGEALGWWRKRGDRPRVRALLALHPELAPARP